MQNNQAQQGLFARNVPGMTGRLARATVGLAGCGGLGSNAAVSLVRAGVGHLILADFDLVEASNLNRQHFFQADIGRPKVEALAAHLQAINPAVNLTLHHKKLTTADIPAIYHEAELLLEAFDQAEAKQWLIETWCQTFPKRQIICASGLAGYGKTHTMTCHNAGQITVCGDQQSEMSEGLCAPRVAMAANMQANVAIEYLMQERKT